MSLENIVSFLCNTEIKCAALVFGVNGVLMSQGQIRSEVYNLFGEEFHVPQSASFRMYCDDSFIPAGLVRSELVYSKDDWDDKGGYPNNNVTWFPLPVFKKTSYGRKTGLPIAKFILHMSSELGYSFHEFFGETAADGGARAPYINSLILEQLADGDELRINDFKLPVNKNKKYFQRLADKGFIDFYSFNSRKGDWSACKWIGGDKGYEPYTVVAKKRVYIRKRMTDRVAELLKKEGPLNYKEVAEKLNYNSVCSVNSVIGCLIKQGVVKLVNEKSSVKIKSKGLEFYTRVLKPIKEFLNGNTQLVDNVLSNLSFTQLLKDCSKAVRQYQTISPFYD